MKTLKLTLIGSLAALLSLTSCVEKSKKYTELKSHLSQMNIAYDSLEQKTNELQTSYDEVIGIINELEKTFDLIREQEKTLQQSFDKKEEVSSKASQKEMIAKINLIQDLLKKNKANISQLQRQLRKLGKENDVLSQNIIAYEQQLKEKVDMIIGLQQQLDEKNQALNHLNMSLDSLNRMSEELQSSIAEQNEKINTVFYIIANSKELKQAKILKSSMSKSDFMEGEFNKAAFTSADLRTLSSINTEVKKFKMLSTHPDGSYKITTNTDGFKVIEILDANKFWSISKYLVVKK